MHGSVSFNLAKGRTKVCSIQADGLFKIRGKAESRKQQAKGASKQTDKFAYTIM